jgi:hypothetical protein
VYAEMSGLSIEGVRLPSAVPVSGRFHMCCGRVDWDLPMCCVFFS